MGYQSFEESIDWAREGMRFDDVSELYDATRPEYPQAIADAIIQRTGLAPETGCILEVGSGSGKATELFARRGFSIVCVDPGANLTAVARRRFADCPNVRFVQCRFQDWQAPEGTFDLLMAASAFHWIPEERRYSLVGRVLKKDGWLALIYPNPLVENTDLRAALDAAYNRFAPELSHGSLDPDERVRVWKENINGSALFGSVEVLCFPGKKHFSAQRYLDLLDTYSDHMRLEASVRRSLYDEIKSVIERTGDGFELSYVTVLLLARRKNVT